jgi:hypothetical protein
MGNIMASSWFKYGVGAVGGIVATLGTQKAWSFFSKPGAIAAPAAPKLVTFDAAKFAALTPEQQQIAVNQAVAAQAAQVS